MLRGLVKEWDIPPLYSQEDSDDPIVYMEIQMIGLRWRWLVLEAEVKTDDILFFGYVAGDAHELGYFTERELLSGGLPIIPQRFVPQLSLSEYKQKYL
jgi:hypothetical protein